MDTTGAPRKTITVQGLSLTVPQPYKAGHPLTEGEASQLNQVLAENLRNNIAKSVKDAVEEAEKAGKEVNVGKIQKAMDDYAANYEFGIRSGGGGFRPTDPVEKVALNISLDIVKRKLRQENVALKEVGAKQMRQMAKDLLDKTPKIYEVARKTVEAEQKALGQAGLEV